MKTRFAIVLGICSSLLACGASTEGEESQAQSAAVEQELTASGLPYRGVNLAGAEFAVDSSGNGPIPGTFGTHYTYPDPAYADGYNGADYFIGKKMNTFRLPFRWERLQPNRGQAFDATEFARLRTTVNNLTAKGAHVLIDPHNYARYGTQLIGSGSVTNAQFADLWTRLSNEFKNNSRVIFGLMNEPYDMPTEQWVNAANAAISAVRQTGAKNLILVPGNAWTGAHSWTQDWYGTANSVAMLNIKDPGNNYAFEVHQYLDASSGGTSESCVSPTIGAERMQVLTNWLKANGKRAFLGEFGSGTSSTCLQAVDGLLNHMEQNSDVYLGWTWWAAGPWWGNYFMTVEPQNGSDTPHMDVLEKHVANTAAPAPEPQPAPQPTPEEPTEAPSEPTEPTAGCEAATIEAESMTASTGGESDGGFNLWSDGYLAATHTFAAGPQLISVSAKGQSAAGVAPHMIVSVGDVVIGEADVASSEYETHTFSFDAQAGGQEIRVTFDNDYYAEGEDRNLLVDKVVVSCE